MFWSIDRHVGVQSAFQTGTFGHGHGTIEWRNAFWCIHFAIYACSGWNAGATRFYCIKLNSISCFAPVSPLCVFSVHCMEKRSAITINYWKQQQTLCFCLLLPLFPTKANTNRRIKFQHNTNISMMCRITFDSRTHTHEPQNAISILSISNIFVHVVLFNRFDLTARIHIVHALQNASFYRKMWVLADFFSAPTSFSHRKRRNWMKKTWKRTIKTSLADFHSTDRQCLKIRQSTVVWHTRILCIPRDK